MIKYKENTYSYVTLYQTEQVVVRKRERKHYLKKVERPGSDFDLLN